MSADADKYIVFKREEFFEMMGGFLPRDNTDCAPIAQEMISAAKETQLDDAVVIRCQDKFAATAFDAYADSVLLAVDLIEDFASTYSKSEVAYLREVVEFFRDRSRASREARRRMPD